MMIEVLWATDIVIHSLKKQPQAVAKFRGVLEYSVAILLSPIAAAASVLVAVAEDAGCDVHLGLVRIEESGSAEYMTAIVNAGAHTAAACAQPIRRAAQHKPFVGEPTSPAPAATVIVASIGQASCDIDFVTLTRGSPHQLQCTKNPADFEPRSRQRESSNSKFKKTSPRFHAKVHPYKVSSSQRRRESMRSRLRRNDERLAPDSLSAFSL